MFYRRFAAIFVLPFLSYSPASWAVNKCVASDGTISFQDAACPSDSKNINPQKTPITAPVSSNVMSPDDMAKAFDKQLESSETQAKIKASIERRELNEKIHAMAVNSDAKNCGGAPSEDPSVGMSESTFLQCTFFSRKWDAIRINELETRQGKQKQFVYPHYAPIKYVYVERGLVTAISR